MAFVAPQIPGINQPEQLDQSQFDPVAFLTDKISRWAEDMDVRQLPAPCPAFFGDCATWWMGVMQKPPQRLESAQDRSVAAWVSWVAFMRLSQEQKQHVIEGVTKHKVEYRGDCYDQYVEIVKNSLEMRKSGSASKQEVVQNFRQLCKKASFKRQASGEKRVSSTKTIRESR